ncbi:MAG TPA: tetratricopeptide repeat protein, partial [Longimicrobiales bacterium]|nr:tetratricopeptide repeat protein [Longimicrobiales bacterium]
PPGDPLHWTGVNLNWNSGCAACHSTGLRKNYSPTSETYATEWVDLDVACEACHGPGSAHVDRAMAALEGGTTGGDAAPADASRADARPTPSGLPVRFEPHDPAAWAPDAATGTARPHPGPDPDDQLDVCGRCHARRSPLTERFEHGAPLLDAYRPALLEEGLYFADGQIRDEVYVWGSFVQSAMLRAGVTCNDCHEPHGLELRAEGNGVCTRCHVASVFDGPDHHGHPDGSEGAACVACHMPERTYMGVDPRRDHSLRVPEPAVAEAVGAPDPCTSCHVGMTPGEAAAAIAARRDGPPIRRTERHAQAIEAGRRGDPDARAGLLELIRDPLAPAITRATALSLLGPGPDPEDVAALDAGMADPDPVVRIGALRAVRDAPSAELVSRAAALLGDPVRAVRLAAVEATAPLLAGAAAPDGVPEGLRSALAAGLVEYREAQEAQADRPEAWMNLAWLAGLRGAPGEVEAALERAIRLDSAFAPAYVNLSDLYRQTGRDAEGEPLLRAGLERAPGSADLHHALGLLLVRAGRGDDARDHLRRAAELEARGTRYAYVWAVALRTDGDTAAARAVLEEALARSPRERDLLLALAVLHRDAGRRGEALRYARALAEAYPSDPSAAALLTEL